MNWIPVQQRLRLAAACGSEARMILRRMRKRWAREWPRMLYRVGLLRITVWRSRRAVWRTGRELFSDADPACRSQWIFHDENWVRVRHRREHRRLVAQGLKPEVQDEYQAFTDEACVDANGSWTFRGHARTADEWLYLYLEPDAHAWRNMRWSFRVRCHTSFRELQFGFRYRDFYNRYRFRFEDGFVHFDKVLRGRFHNELASARFSLEPGRWYDMQMDCRENAFGMRVDGVEILKAWDVQDTFPEGSIAVILWEDDGRTDIRAELDCIHVLELVRADETVGTRGKDGCS